MKTGLAIQQAPLHGALTEMKETIQTWYAAYNRRMPDEYPFIDLSPVRDSTVYMDEFERIIWEEADSYKVRCLEMDVSLVHPSIYEIPLLHDNERLLAMSVLDCDMTYFLAFLLVCNDDDGSTFVRIKSDQQNLRVMWPVLYSCSFELLYLLEEGDSRSVNGPILAPVYREFVGVQFRHLRSAIEQWALHGNMDDFYCHGPVYIGRDHTRMLSDEFSYLFNRPVGYEVQRLPLLPNFTYAQKRLILKRQSADAYMVVCLHWNAKLDLYYVEVIPDNCPWNRVMWH